MNCQTHLETTVTPVVWKEDVGRLQAFFYNNVGKMIKLLACCLVIWYYFHSQTTICVFISTHAEMTWSWFCTSVYVYLLIVFFLLLPLLFYVSWTSSSWIFFCNSWNAGKSRRLLLVRMSCAIVFACCASQRGEWYENACVWGISYICLWIQMEANRLLHCGTFSSREVKLVQSSS